MRVAAIILAAGMSSRMGDFKPLLPLGDKSVLERCVQLFRDAGLSDIIVVTGNRADEVETEARRLDVQTVHNPDFASGMFSSVQCGCAAIPVTTGRFFVLPVDIPLVRCHTLHRLLESVREDVPITYPVFHGERGHPPLLGVSLIEPISDYSGTGGLRGLLEHYECVDVPVADERILFDMDTQKDYAEARNIAVFRGPSEREILALWDMYSMSDQLRRHCRAVADVARVMAFQLNHAGRTEREVDEELCWSAAMLHDIAKGQPRHATAGAALLERHGFSELAPIIADHPDLELLPGDSITEREVVFLADKFVQGDKIVPLASRYQEKLSRYGADPEARAAIEGRLQRAGAVAARFEALMDMPLDRLLETLVVPPR